MTIEDKIKKSVDSSLKKATMCWEPLPIGSIEDKKLAIISEKLVKKINSIIKKQQP